MLSARRFLSVVALACVGAGCGGDGGSAGSIDVFAAASLTDAFTELAQQFESANPGTKVQLSFAASSDLVAQVLEGAPADVLAVADDASMERLADGGGVAGGATVFATNRAAILVAAGNPLGIAGLDDLSDPDLVVVTCAPEVPCGRYATEVFANAGVAVTPRSLEENVRGVVAKVVLGEADAGIVYVTDVLAAGDAASGVTIPDDVNVVAEYPIAITAEAQDVDGAQAFIEFVRSAAGQAVLRSFGFGSP